MRAGEELSPDADLPPRRCVPVAARPVFQLAFSHPHAPGTGGGRKDSRLHLGKPRAQGRPENTAAPGPRPVREPMLPSTGCAPELRPASSALLGLHKAVGGPVPPQDVYTLISPSLPLSIKPVSLYLIVVK